MEQNQAFFINIGSMTSAVRIEESLSKAGYESTVGKTVTDRGCSWGVWVKNASREEVIGFIRREGVNV